MFSIKELRMKKGMSQSDLANVLGLHLRTIQNYEAGTTDIPTKNIKKIAQYFCVNPLQIETRLGSVVEEEAISYENQEAIEKNLIKFMEALTEKVVKRLTEERITEIEKNVVQLLKLDLERRSNENYQEKKKSNNNS